MYLRPANEADLPLMFAWRNNPDIYQGFYQQKKPLNWEEHLNWWKSRPSSWRSFIILLDDFRPIGIINVSQLEHWSPEIGWYIASVSDWGKGYAKQAIRQTFDWLKEKGYKYCHTTVKMDNDRSIHLAWRLGFIVLGGAREGELWLAKDLTQDCQI